MSSVNMIHEHQEIYRPNISTVKNREYARIPSWPQHGVNVQFIKVLMYISLVLLCKTQHFIYMYPTLKTESKTGLNRSSMVWLNLVK